MKGSFLHSSQSPLVSLSSGIFSRARLSFTQSPCLATLTCASRHPFTMRGGQLGSATRSSPRWKRSTRDGVKLTPSALARLNSKSCAGRPQRHLPLVIALPPLNQLRPSRLASSPFPSQLTDRLNGKPSRWPAASDPAFPLSLLLQVAWGALSFQLKLKGASDIGSAIS